MSDIKDDMGNRRQMTPEQVERIEKQKAALDAAHKCHIDAASKLRKEMTQLYHHAAKDWPELWQHKGMCADGQQLLLLL